MKKCFKSYHVTCGVRNGQSVRMEHKGGQVNLISNCDKHSEQKSDEVRKRRTSIDQQIDEERYTHILILHILILHILILHIFNPIFQTHPGRELFHFGVVGARTQTPSAVLNGHA